VPYMQLDGSEIRKEAMPASNRGASNNDLETFLSEWEVEVKRRLGDPLPANDPFLRGILRDLAASSGMHKIALTEEQHAAAEALKEAAEERLSVYMGSEQPTYRITMGVAPWWLPYERN
jgi:hypothetical protein